MFLIKFEFKKMNFPIIYLICYFFNSFFNFKSVRFYLHRFWEIFFAIDQGNEFINEKLLNQ